MHQFIAMFDLRLVSIQVSISSASSISFYYCSTVICHHVTILLRNVTCDCRFRLSEQSLHTHSPSREETIEQRPSYLTYDYDME